MLTSPVLSLLKAYKPMTFKSHEFLKTANACRHELLKATGS
ncbi:hypothetical protein BRYFOR_06777 [Marvinbryantia formatexigens DSM 14469]|uniref:Uncharacterized protein n=1 Tax=Marvinbryantia formatexigens DSM 14469 TaxID=478749 RepID=C6LDS7_9FIRM|nr:hypothetical protein BRYFOR_06777 [Marvinbryantia formatexigens DSM 14469]